METNEKGFSVNDAQAFLIQHFRKNLARGNSGRPHMECYDLILRYDLPSFVAEILGSKPGTLNHEFDDYYPQFYTAAWEFCRQGVLRPGRRNFTQASRSEEFGEAYSLTDQGLHWLQDGGDRKFLPISDSEYDLIISQHVELFGDGFGQRAREARNCFKFNAFLGCCVMCGAAAESILLNLAFKKVGKEAALRIYQRGAGGYVELKKKIVPPKLNQSFQDCFDSVIRYWRHQSAHGEETVISEEHSFMALRFLLDAMEFAKKHFDELTSP